MKNKDEKKELKNNKKAERIERKRKISAEKKSIESKIDELNKQKKNTKDKKEKVTIKKEIKKLEKEYSKVGKIKKDSFLNDVNEEMKLVRWPNKKEILKYSLASFLFVLFFALFFYGIDTIFALIKSIVRGMM